MEDTLLRNYLLGTLDDAARQQVEQYLRVGDMSKAHLSIIEDELVDDYISGQMSAEDRYQFENQFTLDPTRAEKLRFGKLFHSMLLRDSNRSTPDDGREKDHLPDSASRASYPVKPAPVIPLKFHRLSKVAIIAAMAGILAFGFYVLARIQTLSHQIESRERSEEQLRIRIQKIEKDLNLNNENDGSSFRNSLDTADGFQTISDECSNRTTAKC